jgi:hypothetical protein
MVVPGLVYAIYGCYSLMYIYYMNFFFLKKIRQIIATMMLSRIT